MYSEMRMRLLAGLIALLAAGYVLAQDPCGAAAERLRSASLTEKAWGAHFAAPCRLSGLEAELAAVHFEPTDSPQATAEKRSLVQALLDALIQTQALVSPALLARFRPQWPAETLILLVRNAGAAEEALRALALLEPPDAEWVAVNNVLVARRASGVAAQLLNGLELTHQITVFDPGPPPGSAGAVFGGLTASSLSVAPGFPPTGFYRLVLAEDDPDGALLAEGAQPVFFERKTEGTWPPSANPYFISRRDFRLEYLAVLSGLPAGRVRGAVRPETLIEWRDFADFQVRTSRALAAQPAAVREVLQALVDSGALSAEQAAGLRLRIAVRLDDRRGDRTPALPPPSPIDVRWSRP